MPKVSVIVPVYNTEKYLPECIESILAQSFIDFELILINDGSKDTSGEICDEYALKDARIVVIHKINGGANRARETGVYASKGEWITFVDSDDIITIDYLKILVSHISDTRDIVIGQIKNHNYVPGIYTIDEYRTDLIRGKYPCPYTKLYRATLFSKQIFDTPREIIIAEDHLMNIRLSFATDKNVLIIPDVIYMYRIRPNSTLHSHNHTYNYCNIFFRHFLNAIPPEFHKKYSDSIFHIAYDNWSNFCGYKFIIPTEWKDYEVTKYVIETSTQKYYLLKKFDLQLINSKKFIIRALFILLKKINNRFRL